MAFLARFKQKHGLFAPVSHDFAFFALYISLVPTTAPIDSTDGTGGHLGRRQRWLATQAPLGALAQRAIGRWQLLMSQHDGDP
jgi:hypothetical protein